MVKKALFCERALSTGGGLGAKSKGCLGPFEGRGGWPTNFVYPTVFRENQHWAPIPYMGKM